MGNFGLLASLLLIVWGIFMTNPKLYTRMIKAGNETKGVKTKITKTTLYNGRILGYTLILIGVFNLVLMKLGYY